MTTQDDSLFEREGDGTSHGPVECLGLYFANDDERRAHFTELLREKLKDQRFRDIEGFPIGADEDILALSDPPYHTACPNPWLAEFIAQFQSQLPANREDVSVAPIAYDVTEGKRDPLYEHYSYHTKVPHRAVAKYIAHYTRPGDIVLDAFSGSGMTGLAAKSLLSSAPSGSERGERQALLVDLSPYATFIGHNYNRQSPQRLDKAFSEVATELGWMYQTKDPAGTSREINYTVWSDVFLCWHCGREIIFFDEFVDEQTGAVRAKSQCGGCGAEITKSNLEASWITVTDDLLGQPVRIAKQVPVLIKYFVGTRQHQKTPDASDLEVIERVAEHSLTTWAPVFELPLGFNTNQPRNSHGVTHSHMFFTRRNLIAVSALWDVAEKASSAFWRFELLGGFRVWTRRSIFLTTAWKQGGTGAFKPSTTGILYMPSISGERNVFSSFRERQRKAMAFVKGLPVASTPSVSSTHSSTSLPMIPDSVVDYVFVDPPFGANLMYSELNTVFEPWLRVVTGAQEEAICNPVQHKDEAFYLARMTEAFTEIARVLKPGRWMTVEFHNSKNSIWNIIQLGLQRAGLVVAEVGLLDKKQGTFKQYTSANIAKSDLAINAYKPTEEIEAAVRKPGDVSGGIWAFIRSHLERLPLAVTQGSVIEIVAERQAYLLYDRMVAFHVQRGIQVPLSAADFYAGLEQRFPCRDGMYFLSEQVADYDRKRLQAQDVRQLELFVTDEASAIQWLRQTLSDRSMSFQDLHPLFMQEIAGWEKHERPLELSELLEENFIRYEGAGEVPSQIHAYLSSNFREMRGLDKNDSALRAKAKDRWFVPDPRKAGDLEHLRERTLLKEFDDYAAGKGKLKLFRVEAVRAGFKRAWQEHDYETIIEVSERLPTDVLQEDAKLLMWYDQALTRAGE